MVALVPKVAAVELMELLTWLAGAAAWTADRANPTVLRTKPLD